MQVIGNVQYKPREYKKEKVLKMCSVQKIIEGCLSMPEKAEG